MTESNLAEFNCAKLARIKDLIFKGIKKYIINNQSCTIISNQKKKVQKRKIFYEQFYVKQHN